MSIQTPSNLAGFKGRRVLSLESRMSSIMGEGIVRHRGVPVLAPSMQEIPLENNPELISFAAKFIAGEIGLLILLTGVGTRQLLGFLIQHHDKTSVLEAFKKITLVARGPKPVSALAEWKIRPDITVPEPNTWKEIVEILKYGKEGIPLDGTTIAIQEYGIPNYELIQALKKEGARIVQVPVYRWALPDDRKPLERAIEEILAGGIDFALFTNAAQIRHMLKVAGETGDEDKLLKGLQKVVVASVGPACSEALKESGVQVDFEPSHPKMGHLIAETAKFADRLLDEKRAGFVLYPLQLKDAVEKQSRAARENSPLMLACRLKPAGRKPVWFMRQAGRYMKEYRNMRNKVSFLELCKTPELCAQAAVHAQETLGADAAILFSDILLILEPMGLDLTYTKGDGPSLGAGIRGKDEVDKLREVSAAESLPYVVDAVKITRESLAADIPLIGFCGAPFTLASYMIEGGASKYFLETKQFMYKDPGVWRELMQKLVRSVSSLLHAQIDAGADLVQIFDSWAGCLSPADYQDFVMPYTKALVDSIGSKVPVIHFATGTGSFLELMRGAGGDVLSVDSKIDLSKAWEVIGPDRGIQGNLDPALLFAPFEVIRSQAKKILDQAAGKPGHIFNLGHGILPGTPVDNVRSLIDFVHEYKPAGPGL